MSSTMIAVLVLIAFFHLGKGYYKIVPQFNSANIGPNTIIHDAIMINSNQNLIASYNQNGIQYISRYIVQNGGLALQLMITVTTYDPFLIGEPIILLCVNSIQTQLIAFTGYNFQLYTLDINTLNKISTSTITTNISQMIWSPVNNNIYYVDQNGIFGFLSVTIGIWSTTNLYAIAPGFLKMSVSLNYNFMAISSALVQQLIIYDIINHNFWDSQNMIEANALAHQWMSNDILYIMPPTTGDLCNYNATSKSMNCFNCFASGIYNVFSFHMHLLSNSSQQFIIGSSLSMDISFLQFDINTLTVVNSTTFIQIQNLVQIKYSTSSPQKGLLIFNSFIDSIKIIEPCQIGYVFDTNLNQCVSNNLIVTQLSVQQQKFFTNVLSVTTSNSIIKICNQVPGNRKILQPIFVFFINYDDIQLYIYHQRQYDYVLQSLFSTIQTLQNQKWKTIKFEELWGYIGVNTTFIKEKFNNKFNYTSWKFIEVQGYSSGFIINTLNYFFSNLLLIFLMFLILRTVFFFLFKYQISKIFRYYSFWPYLYFMMLEGNLQFLSYMYLCQLLHFFSLNFSNKCELVFMICIFFLLILLISCSHLILRQTYGFLAKYFFDETKTSIQASIYLILQFGFRNFLLGAVHALFNQNYLLKISLLLSVQICFMINCLFFLGKQNFFQNKTRITINLVAALLRICIIFTFIIDKQERKQLLEMTTLSIILEKVHYIIVIFYMFIGIFSTGFQISKIVYEVLYFIILNKKNQEKILQSSQREKMQTNVVLKKVNIQQHCIFQQCLVNQHGNQDIQNLDPKRKELKRKVIKKHILKKHLNKNLIINQAQMTKQLQSATFQINSIQIQKNKND